MHRRGFLASLGAFAAGAVLDPERLLWIPGAKTISIPAPLRPIRWIGVNVTLDRDLYLPPGSIIHNCNIQTSGYSLHTDESRPAITNTGFYCNPWYFGVSGPPISLIGNEYGFTIGPIHFNAHGKAA